MPSPATAFKAAQEAALRGSADLKTAMGLATARIYTEAPTNAPVPYVVIGLDQVLIEQNEGCADEAEIFATVSWWSRVSPLDKGAQARAMGEAIVDALNLQLTITGWTVDVWELQQERYVTDPDQSTHGLAEFHYQLTAQT